MRIQANRINLITITLLAMVTSTSYAKEKFKVCADPLNPPYSTQKQDGFENKVAEFVAKELGQELEYTWFPQRIGFVRNTLMAHPKETDVDSDEYKCDVVMGLPTGYDLTETTIPYYKSTYVLLIVKGRGWDDITLDAAQLTNIPPERQDKLKIATGYYLAAKKRVAGIRHTLPKHVGRRPEQYCHANRQRPESQKN
jgi:ABC-type amino acid transport substrate-binding protein